MRPRPLPTRAVLSLLGLLALLALLATASPAEAHSELVSSTPKAGSRLTAVPASVTLTFSEAVDPAGVRVTAGAGHRPLPVTRPAGGGTRSVAVALAAAKDTVSGGRLRLVWRAVDEEDGHATTGLLTFLVGPVTMPGGHSDARPAPENPGFTVPRASPTVHDALLADRWLGYLCLALFLGGLTFVATLWPQGPAADRRARLLLSAAWAGGLLSSAAQIGLQGAYTRLGSFTDAFRADTYRQTLPTDIGIDLAARTLLWVLAAVVLAAVMGGGEAALRSPGWRVGAAAVGLGLLRTTGMAGHNAEGAHPVWGEIADLVHLLGVSLWIGGLTVLLVAVLPRREPRELASVVAGYSTLAATAVTAITGAGAVLAWQLVGSWHALFATSYGHLLLLKIALLSLVLIAAGRSRSWVRTRLDIAVLLRGDRATVRPFVYSVAAETGLVMAVLVAASYLVTANPGR
jgi:copper transport protein